MSKQIEKSVGQLNQEAALAPLESVDETMAFFDKWADEDFAEQYGIEVADISAFIAKMRGEG